ncbi:MAG: hypothetical protein GX208_01320 [Firmicutes bacterium]|nr:hypothetical protein [Bacillota bacterium]
MDLVSSEIIQIILRRINELKFQRARLRPFIESDREKLEQIEFALAELEEILKQSTKLKSS